MKVLKLGTITLPAFQYRIKVIVTNDVHAYSHSRGFHDADYEPEASTLYDGATSELVFHPFPEPGTVAHEAWHAVRNMLRGAGAGLDNETVAYHLGYVVQKVTDMLYKAMDKMEKMPCACGCDSKESDES